MTKLLPLLLTLCLTPLSFGQAAPPIPIENIIWDLQQSDGSPIEHQGTGEDLDITAKFTVTDPFNGSLDGKSFLDGNVIESTVVQYLMDGLYTWENPTKGTWGYMIWNANGYYDLWSSYNGGTTRRMAPST